MSTENPMKRKKSRSKRETSSEDKKEAITIEAVQLVQAFEAAEICCEAFGLCCGNSQKEHKRRHCSNKSSQKRYQK